MKKRAKKNFYSCLVIFLVFFILGIILFNNVIESNKKITSLSGRIKVIAMDDFNNDKSEIKYYLVEDNGARHELHFSENTNLNSGERIEINRIKKDNIALGDYDILFSPAWYYDKSLNLGEQKTAVILINYTGFEIEVTPEDIKNKIFNESNSDSVNTYLREFSYNQTWLSGDVYGKYALPYFKICDYSLLLNETIESADADIDFTKYRRLIIIFPTSCSYQGVASIGYEDVIYTDDSPEPINLTVAEISTFPDLYSPLVVHELGHNFGVYHANDWECGEFSIGNGSYNDASCVSVERGDAFSIMGEEDIMDKPLDFNSVHKEKIGWLNSSEIREINQWGVYTINSLENSKGIRALKIPAGNKNYYVEFRRPTGAYSALNKIYGDDFFDGAFVYLDYFTNNPEAGGDSQLIDATPHKDDELRQAFDSLNVTLNIGTKLNLLNTSQGNIIARPISLNDKYMKVYIGPESSFGNKKVAIILVNFSFDRREIISKQDAANLILEETKGFFNENSYGNLKLQGSIADVYGTYELSSGKIEEAAILAADKDIDYRNYDLIVVLYPLNDPFDVRGGAFSKNILTDEGNITFLIARATRYTSQSKWTLNDIKNVAGTVEHEIGHLLGFKGDIRNSPQTLVGEASGYECGEKSIDEAGCTALLYNDVYDIMGLSSPGTEKGGHINSIYKEKLGWVNQENISVYEKPGTYKIKAWELATNDSQLLKIPAVINGTKIEYYLEYRPFTGFDSILSDFGFTPGVLIHLPCLEGFCPGANNPQIYSLLIDTTPNSAEDTGVYPKEDFNDSALAFGESFIDLINNLNITVLSGSIEEAVISVRSIIDIEDIIPPVISLIVNGSISNQSALISWNTDENANSAVHYGLTMLLGASVSNGARVLFHSLQLPGLLANTIYYYKVESCDSSGNCANSSIYEFKTLEENETYVDIEAPVIALGAPENATSLNQQSVGFTYTPSDYSIISNCTLFIGVESRVDTAIENDTINTFSMTLSNGDYIWNISCIDIFSNRGESETRTLNVNYVASPVDNGGGGGGGGMIPKPKVENVTKTTTMPGEEEKNTIILGDELIFVDVTGEERIIIDQYGNRYLVSFALVDGEVVATLFNGDYIIPRGDVLPISIGDEEIYAGIFEGGAKVALGLDKEEVLKKIMENVIEKEDGKNNKSLFYFATFGIVGILIITIIILIVVYLKKAILVSPLKIKIFN